MPWRCCAPSSKNRQENCLTILSVWFFRDLDVIDRWRFIIAAMSVVALVVLITATAGQHHTPPPRLVGDELGRDNDETLTDYVQRVQQGFSAAAPGDEVYALVTFRQPLTAQAAGAVVQNIARVNAFEVGFAPVVGIPEPVKGVNRGDSLVHHITLKQMNPLDVRGLVVHDSVEKLHVLAKNSKVLAIEVLPPDATWGSFAVRPVNVS